MSNYLDYIISGVIGTFIGMILEIMFQPLKKISKHLKIIRPLRKKARENLPHDFVALTYKWKESEKEEEYKNNSLLYSRFRRFIKSKDNILLIMGTYGSGKTYLCKYLAGRLVDTYKRVFREIPIYIDGSKIRSENIPSEIRNRIDSSNLTDLSPSDLRNLIKKKRVVIFLDGLDQLPYLLDSSNILDDILAFALNDFLRGRNKSKVVLVVREEFYKVSQELRDFVSRQIIPILYVQGLSDEQQIRNFIQATDKEHGEDRWQKVNELITKDPNLSNLFHIPMVLRRFISIDINSVKQMDPTGTTLATIFRLSFESLDVEDREVLQHLAYFLYKNDDYHFSANRDLFTYVEFDKTTFNKVLNRVGILTMQDGDYQFSHTSYRDYFAAEQILQAINQNEGEAFLSDRLLHYLVSEFIAGLIENESLSKLMMILNNTTSNDLVRTNIIDILSELENSTLRDQVSKLIDEKIKELDFDEEMNEYKMYLAAVAGVFGFREPVEKLIQYVKDVGVKRFLEMFFVTKNLFKYYGKSQDRCFLEWMKILELKRYGYLRFLACYLLGEVRFEQAKSCMRNIIRDDSEYYVIKQYAEEAIEKLMRKEQSDAR